MTKLLKNYPLSKSNNLNTGGKAEIVLIPQSATELKQLLLEHPNTPLIAGGTNCIVSDNNIKKIILLNQVKTEPQIISKNVISISAAQKIGPLLKFMKNNRLKGLGFMAGIPGNTIGGAIFQNFGAYGKTISEFIKSVTFIKNEKEQSINIQDISFEYRSSIFKQQKLKVISAELILPSGTPAELYNEITETTHKRRQHNPLKHPNIGCIFKNPNNNFAGKLIEDCNLKGYNINGAEVWSGHANFIINKGTEKTADILELIKYIKETVMDKTGTMLEEEINYIGNKNE